MRWRENHHELLRCRPAHRTPMEHTMHPKLRGHRTDVEESYRVTYAFNGHRCQTVDEAVSRIRETVGRMQEEGLDIELLGASGEVDTADHGIEVTARYAAPSKGTIGRLNTRARLPASGSPQRSGSKNTQSTKQSPLRRSG